MKFRALKIASVVFASCLATNIAFGGNERHSCQKALARAIEALSAYARASVTAIRAEVAAGPMGFKHVMSREVEAGEYIAFASGEKGMITQFEISALDGSGKELKSSKGVDEVVLNGLTLDSKQTIKIQVEITDTAQQGKQVGSFIVVLLTKKQPPEFTDFIFESALKQVKEMEGDGFDITHAVFDTLSKDKPWALKEKLSAGAHRIDAVSDDAKVKDLQLECKDGAGASLGKDTRTDHIATCKAEAKAAGDHTIAVNATWNEGEKETFAGVLVGTK